MASASQDVAVPRGPKIIDGVVVRSWFPRPATAALTGSGLLLALGAAALVQQVIR